MYVSFFNIGGGPQEHTHMDSSLLAAHLVLKLRFDDFHFWTLYGCLACVCLFYGELTDFGAPF